MEQSRDIVKLKRAVEVLQRPRSEMYMEESEHRYLHIS